MKCPNCDTGELRIDSFKDDKGICESCDAIYKVKIKLEIIGFKR